MRTRAVATAVAVVLSFGVLVAQASLVLDQSSPAQVPPATTTFAVGGPVNQVVSQTVTAGVSGRLRAVDVPIACESGELILEIRDVDTAGQPGTTLYYTEAYDIADFPGPLNGTFHRIRLRGMPVRFTAGDSFSISLGNPTGVCGLWPGLLGDGYAGGTGWGDSSDGPIAPLILSGTDDIPFQTFVQ